jgi:hypothetical protein
MLVRAHLRTSVEQMSAYLMELRVEMVACMEGVDSAWASCAGPKSPENGFAVEAIDYQTGCSEFLRDLLAQWHAHVEVAVACCGSRQHPQDFETADRRRASWLEPLQWAVSLLVGRPGEDLVILVEVESSF